MCPAAPSPVTSPNGLPTVVQYGTPIASGGAPAVSVTCAPASGSMFPVGTTAVRCTATDGRQRADSCTFNVVVQQPPRISLTRFVAFGDSITWGEDGRSTSIVSQGSRSSIQPAVRLPVALTYPGVLEGKLRARYTTQIQLLSVFNAGIPGELAGASATLTRFSALMSTRAYESVLLMEGSNDLGERDAAKIPGAINNLQTMLRDAKSRNVRPFLATVPPMVPGRQRSLAWSLVPELNSRIRSLAVTEGVTLVDIETGFGTPFDQYIGADGLHPNEAGYAKIADLFFSILQSSLETQAASTTTSLPFFHPSSQRPGRR
jgi:lysophospholipase L1-like esterase